MNFSFEFLGLKWAANQKSKTFKKGKTWYEELFENIPHLWLIYFFCIKMLIVNISWIKGDSLFRFFEQSFKKVKYQQDLF